MKYKFGHVEPWWDDSFKSLDYIYTPLTNTDDLIRWINEGYRGLNLNGAIYDMKQEIPDYGKPFLTLFDWEHVGITFFRMVTCEALPLHSDAYNSYRKMFNIEDPNTIWRCVVFLDDWKSGHYFEIDGTPYLNWKKGDYVMWNYNVPHFAGNFGTEPRYTMQITGVKRP
jgi:hypothetical protein